jgi:hypothetical protein
MLSLFLGLLVSMFIVFLAVAKIMTLGGVILCLVLFFLICRLGLRLVRFCLWGPPPPRACAGRLGAACGRPQQARAYAHPVPPVPPRNPPPRVAPPRPASTSPHTWPLLAIGLVLFCGVALSIRMWEESRVALARAHAEMQTKPPRPVHRQEPVKVRAVRPNAPAENPVPVASGNPLWTTTVDGSGLSDKDARQKALEEACTKWREFLRDQLPPVDWMPTPEDVQRILPQDWQEETALEKDDPLLGPIKIFRVSLTVQVGARERDEIVKLDQHHRMEQRMLWLGKIFAGVLVLLVAVAGYIRLDEWSKGYYSGWLRLVAVGLIAAAGVGVWVLLQQRGLLIP